MILDATTKSLSVTLGAAKTTNDMDIVTAFADVTSAAYTDGGFDGLTNGTTETTIVAAPAASTRRRVKFISIYNADVIQHTVTIKHVNGTDKRILWTGVLAIGATLVYVNGVWSSISSGTRWGSGSGAPDNAVGSDGDYYFRTSNSNIYQRQSGTYVVIASVDAAARSINTQTADYTLALTDAGSIVEMDVATANNLTVPPNTSVPFQIGTQIDHTQYGAGQTTFVPGSGVTIRSPSSKVKSTGQYSGQTLYKRATDEWVLLGDLS